jgi:ribosome maturation factor RimP
MNRIEDRVRSAVTPFLEENGCRLWDVVFEKEGALYYLRVLFDGKDGGFLDIELCEKLTAPLNKLIDALSVTQIDIVEIGSPGITRQLRRPEHFELCTGKPVRVMNRADNGKTEVVRGILTGCNADNKTITVGSNEYSLKRIIRVTLDSQEEEMQ